MREFIPGLGDRKARQRIDELFSRQTLGAVLFGSAASKVVEKANMIAVIVAMAYVFGLEPTRDMWVVALCLIIMWGIELVLFTYLYVRWEEAMKAMDEKKDQVKEKASKTADKAKEKAEEATDESDSETE